jgi:hypothetical protein
VTVNALLVRWQGGWHEVLDEASIAAHGRSEMLLGLGAAHTLSEVETIARRLLADRARPRREITAEIAPQGATDTPYVGFGVGDTVDLGAFSGRERVMALTVAEDEHGNVSYAPELADVWMLHAERYEQAIKKMVDGTGGGTVKVATPASMVATAEDGSRRCCGPSILSSGWTIVASGASLALSPSGSWFSQLYSQATEVGPLAGNLVEVTASGTWGGSLSFTATLQVRVGGLWQDWYDVSLYGDGSGSAHHDASYTGSSPWPEGVDAVRIRITSVGDHMHSFAASYRFTGGVGEVAIGFLGGT